MFRHLKEENITYILHFKRAISMSYKSLKASVCFFIHGIYPDIFSYTGSFIIKDLYSELY